MNKGLGTIYFDDKRKRYIAQCTLGRNADGKTIRKSVYGKTKKEAYDKLIEIQSKYNKGVYTDSNNITLSFWIEKYFMMYKVHDYKTATFEKEFRRSKRIRESYLGSMILDKIKPIDIQQFINEQTTKISAKTIRNLFTILNGAMKQAAAEKFIPCNPCEYIKLPKVQKPTTYALDDKQIRVFLEKAKSNTYYDIYLFALNTGMRESEIVGLKRNKVDLKENKILVNEQLVRIKGGFITDTPKTKKSIRTIPLNDTARKIIEKHLYSDVASIEYVFLNPVAKTIKQNTLAANIKKVYKECYKETGDEIFLKANFHTLRHTFATNWIIKGGNSVLLSKMLGHSEPAFTQRVYVQPNTEDIEKELLKVECSWNAIQ